MTFGKINHKWNNLKILFAGEEIHQYNSQEQILTPKQSIFVECVDQMNTIAAEKERGVPYYVSYYSTLGYEAVHPGDYKLKGWDETFVIGSQAQVHVGPDVNIRRRITASQKIEKEIPLLQVLIFRLELQ